MDSKDTLLRRELTASLAREDEYRRRLWRQRELADRLRSHTSLLREALRQAAPGPEWLDALIRNIATHSAEALQVSRTSVWLFDDRREYLVCRRLVEADPTAPLPAPIPVANCPGYMRALLSSSTSALAVNDARSDARTVELREYLQQHDVHALLDIPILTPGLFRGVVCHEAQGSPREWLEEEVNFATDVAAIVAIALEAEQRMRAERAAQGSEAKYRHLVESLPVSVYSFEIKTGQLDYVSPQLHAIAGMPAESYLLAGGLQRWLSMVEAEYRPAIEQRLRQPEDVGFETELTYPIRLADGSRRWIRDTCGFVRDARGRVIAAQGTLADVTALREAQLARSELERRYRALFEHADFLAVILDRDGRVQFINDAFLRALGVNKEEAIGAEAFVLGLAEAEGDLIRQQFLSGIRNGQLAPRSETSLKQRGGQKKRILWTNTLIHSADDSIAGAASVGVDITERLEHQNAALEREKLESLGRLAASVAHDFNNLLTVLSGGTNLLAITPAEAPAILSDMNEAIAHAAELTASLLTYARKDSVAPAALRPDDLILRVLPMLKAMAGLDVALACDLRSPNAVVTIDPTQLRQVLLNLIGNASEAVRGHGSCIRIASRLASLDAAQTRSRGLAKAGGFYVATVSDDGRGIPPDVLPHIFDPFFTTKQNGTGLGLATSYSVVQQAGGFLDVKSVPLEGTTFDVYLPAIESETLPRDGTPIPERG